MDISLELEGERGAKYRHRIFPTALARFLAPAPPPIGEPEPAQPAHRIHGLDIAVGSGQGLPNGGLNPPVTGNSLGLPHFNLPENPAGLRPGTHRVGLNEQTPFSVYLAWQTK
jgi:hypothetical protein